jgi:hypothetical protein
VILGDGSTFKMADTEANQREYPQQSSQKPGCGFSIVCALVLFSPAVGTGIEAPVSPYSGKQTGKNSLLRTFHESDVLVLDRYFSASFEIALLQQRGVDVVVRKHQLRATDFRTGPCLWKDDQLLVWSKPSMPTWIHSEIYNGLLESLHLREIRLRVTRPGFRTQKLVIVTTLLDSDEYTHGDPPTVYRQRWQAEVC